jgi:hypothetical protein
LLHQPFRLFLPPRPPWPNGKPPPKFASNASIYCAQLIGEMRQPRLRLTEEQKRKGVALFDKRINKRIEQILEVQKSLRVHKDYDRYKTTSGSCNGYYSTQYTAPNDDFRQNQRVTNYTNSQRKDFSTLFVRYTSFLDELSGLNSTRASLEALKQKTF